MPISTQCPHCAAYDSFPDADAGQSVSCPACGGAIALPLKPRPVAAVVAQARPIAAKPLSKPLVDLDDDDDRPRKKSKPVVDLDDEDHERPRKKKSKPAVDLDGDEDRPRKKSKPIVDSDGDEAPAPKSKSKPEFAFDDDADEMPRKKKPRRRDDEEQDDRPRRKPAKKGGSGKLLLILGGIAFVLLAGCAGIGVYFYMKVDKAVTDIKSQMTFPSDPETGKPTKSDDGKPKVKVNVGKVVRGDSHASVGTKMGVGSDAMIVDLIEIRKTFKEGDGVQTKANLQIVLDAYAPWVEKGRGLVYRDGADFRALIVFSGVSPKKQDWKVYGVLTIEQIGDRSEYNEQVGLAPVTSGDPEAQKLNLKGWKNLRVGDGTSDDSQVPAGTVVKMTAVDLAAELVKDRRATAKKYAVCALEVTGEVNSGTTSGNILNLKGGTDDETMKPVLIQVVMQPEVRERTEAKKCRPGDTVTITGTLQAQPVTGTIFPLINGAFKK